MNHYFSVDPLLDGPLKLRTQHFIECNLFYLGITVTIWKNDETLTLQICNTTFRHAIQFQFFDISVLI